MTMDHFDATLTVEDLFPGEDFSRYCTHCGRPSCNPDTCPDDEDDCSSNLDDDQTFGFFFDDDLADEVEREREALQRDEDEFTAL
jgi:hypothetical protein